MIKRMSTKKYNNDFWLGMVKKMEADMGETFIERLAGLAGYTKQPTRFKRIKLFIYKIFHNYYNRYGN